MNNKKDNVRNNIKLIIRKLSDIDFQINVWLNGEYWDSITDFGEAINSLDDVCFFDSIKDNSIRFDNIENQKKLSNFAKILLEYEEPKEVSDMLKSEKWLDIVEQAKDIYTIISDLIVDI